MKKIIILLILLMVFTVGCDTELGHSSEEGHDHELEDHDHDEDGIQDHTAEEHEEELETIN